MLKSLNNPSCVVCYLTKHVMKSKIICEHLNVDNIFIFLEVKFLSYRKYANTQNKEIAFNSALG